MVSKTRRSRKTRRNKRTRRNNRRENSTRRRKIKRGGTPNKRQKTELGSPSTPLDQPIAPYIPEVTEVASYMADLTPQDRFSPPKSPKRKLPPKALYNILTQEDHDFFDNPRTPLLRSRIYERDSPKPPRISRSRRFNAD